MIVLILRIVAIILAIADICLLATFILDIIAEGGE